MAKIIIQNKFDFKSFFNDYYENFVIYAHGYLFDKNASEDLVQEAFIELWKRIEKGEISSSPKAYMLKMVKNRCLNELKRKKVIDPSEILDINLLLVEDSENETQFLEIGEQFGNQILNILDALPNRMQEIFKMKVLSGYKYNEIAEELGISVNTVKIQLKRAKLKIGQLMMLLTILCIIFLSI